ncbi:MAG: type II secretion system F family protein [Candidatus Diapherotrites archaeon]
MILGIYERVCRGVCDTIPQKTREQKVFKELHYAGIREDFDIWLGKRMLLIMIIGLIGLLLPWATGTTFGLLEIGTPLVFVLGEFSIPFSPVLFGFGLIIGISLMLLSMVSVYLHVFYQIEGRVSFVDNILPDFLLLVSSNIAAGMTPFAAFRNSARKEFGPLSDEIKRASSKALGEQSFTQAISELSKRIRSSSLKETVSFFSQSLRSGGHLSKLLETSAEQLRQTQEMKKELISSSKMYVIFVVFVVVIGTPLLLGVSVQFLEIISSIQEQSSVGGNVIDSVSFLSTELNITPEFMEFAAFLLLFVNSLLSSLFIGVIGSGNAKLGLKNFPLLLVASFAVFIVANAFLGQFLAF